MGMLVLIIQLKSLSTESKEGKPAVEKGIDDIFKVEWENIWSDYYNEKINTLGMCVVNFIIDRNVVLATANFDAMVFPAKNIFLPHKWMEFYNSVQLLVCWRLCQ